VWGSYVKDLDRSMDSEVSYGAVFLGVKTIPSYRNAPINYYVVVYGGNPLSGAYKPFKDSFPNPSV
jgi:hypothetical protein